MNSVPVSVRVGLLIGPTVFFFTLIKEGVWKSALAGAGAALAAASVIYICQLIGRSSL